MYNPLLCAVKDFGSTPAHWWETCLTSLQVIDPAFCCTKLPVPSSHAIQLLMLLLIRNSLPMVRHKAKAIASKSVSLSGTVVDTRVLAALAVQLGRGVTAFSPLVKLE